MAPKEPRQHCDSTCWYCAHEFWRWLQDRNRRPKTGRSGPGDFFFEAVASRRTAEMADELTQAVAATKAATKCPFCHEPFRLDENGKFPYHGKHGKRITEKTLPHTVPCPGSGRAFVVLEEVSE